jgi:hypothetical protein
VQELRFDHSHFWKRSCSEKKNESQEKTDYCCIMMTVVLAKSDETFLCLEQNRTPHIQQEDNWLGAIEQ